MDQRQLKLQNALNPCKLTLYAFSFLQNQLRAVTIIYSILYFVTSIYLARQTPSCDLYNQMATDKYKENITRYCPCQFGNFRIIGNVRFYGPF